MTKPALNLPALVHHRPSGRARVRLAGRDVWLGPWGSPEAEERYRRVVGEWLAHGRLPDVAPVSGRPVAAAVSAALSGPVVNELILAYWRHAKAYYVKNGEPTSQLGGIRDALAVLREHYGRTSAADFGPLKLEALRDGWVRGGLTRPGVNRRVGHLKRAFKWGVAKELVPPAVYQKLAALEGLKKGRTEAPDPPKVRPVSAEDVEKTLPQLSPIVRDMVTLQLLTGARPGEVCVLRPCDVDRGSDVWEYAPPTHKNEHRGQDRRLYLGPQAQAVLAPYLPNREPDACCFSPAEAVAASRARRTGLRKTPLSCGNRPGTRRTIAPKRAAGRRWTAGSYRHAVHEACDRAGVARWSPNRLRHARATFLRQRYGIEAARVVLGHSTSDTTAIYAEGDLARAREIMREVG